MDPKIIKNFKKFSSYTRILAIVLAFLGIFVYLFTGILWLARALLIGSFCAMMHALILMLLSKNHEA